MHILLKSYKLLTWRAVMFSAGLTRSARLPIFVCIGDKGKDYASPPRETRARKRRPLFLYCEGEFTVWRPFHPHVKAGRCLGLVLKFTDDYVKLLSCYSESACFSTLETSPRGLWIGSVITVSISTDPVWGTDIATRLRLYRCA